MALSLLKEITQPPPSIFFLCLSHSHLVFLQLPFLLHGERKEVQCAVCGMIHWVNSSSLGAACEDMVVFECVTVASEGCRCLEGCCEEVLRGRVFHQGYGGFCDACVSVTVHMQGEKGMGGVEWFWLCNLCISQVHLNTKVVYFVLFCRLCVRCHYLYQFRQDKASCDVPGVISGHTYCASTRMPMFTSAPVCSMCAFLGAHVQWLLASVVLLMVLWEQAELKDQCQMGIFQGQQNCENKWGPWKGPELCSIVKLSVWTAWASWI